MHNMRTTHLRTTTGDIRVPGHIMPVTLITTATIQERRHTLGTRRRLGTPILIPTLLGFRMPDGADRSALSWRAITLGAIEGGG